MFSRIAIALLLTSSSAFAAPPADANDDHIKVSLISEQTALVPGTTTWLGLRLTHEPHWHTYWVNPGDSGLPTKIAWQLPTGYAASDVAWPVPKRIAVGDVVNFGYTGDMVLPVQIDVPGDAQEGSIVHMSAEAKWLVCRDECVPGSATVSIDLPVHSITANDPEVATFFDAAHAAQPKPASWNGTTHVSGDSVEVVLRGRALPTVKPLDVFVVDRRVVTYAPPKIVAQNGEITLLFKKSEYFTSAPTQLNLVVRAGEGATAPTWRVAVPFDIAESNPPSRPGH